MAITGIAALFLVAYVHFLAKDAKESKAVAALPTIPVEHLRNGHIICRHGDGLWSNLIIRMNPVDKRFSHIGVLVESDAGMTVVHADTSSRFATSGKVVQEPLTTFLAHSRRIGVFRHKRVSTVQLAASACHYLGRPFDWKLDDKESNAVYCSELMKLAIGESLPGETVRHVKCGNQEVVPVDAFITPEHSIELYEWQGL